MTGRNSTVELRGKGVDMAERYRKGRSKRRTSRSTPDEENPWYQEKKKHESEVDERAKQISTSMAKLAFENLNTVVFSIPLTDGKMRKIVEYIEAEIRKTGINFLKIEGVWDENNESDKSRYVLEKLSKDLVKIESFAESEGERVNLMLPIIFCFLFHDEDSERKTTPDRWRNQDLRIFCLNEKAEWKKSTGNFGNWVDYRLDDMSLERSCLEPTSVGYSDYSLHPLMLFSDTRLPNYGAQAVFIVDPHLNLEHFSELQPNLKTVIDPYSTSEVTFDYEDYEDIVDD